MNTLIPKLDSRSRHQVLRRARHPNLTRPGAGENLPGDGNRDAIQPVAFEFALPRVDAGADFESQLT
jgi:hypothetical protein